MDDKSVGMEQIAALNRAFSGKSPEDCERILILQRYHETLFAYGIDLPKVGGLAREAHARV